MSRASDLEAARLAKERTDARCDAIQIAVTSKDSHVVLVDFARQMLAEATYVAEQRKSGWKSRSDAHTAAGRILGQWAKDLAAYLERDKPPMRPPLETIAGPTMYEHLDPADGPISAQITSGLMSQASEGPVTADVARAIREAKTVDDKLDVAFGPVSPRAELIERDDALESRANAGDPIASAVLLGRELERADPGWPDRLTGLEPAAVHITAAPANYAWCDATTGARGYVGSATCPDCIARYDAHHTGPMTGVSAVYLWPDNGDEPIVMTAHANGPVVTIDWNAKGEATVSIPKFSEPGPGVVLLTGSRDWTEVGQIHDLLAGMQAAIPGLVIRHGDCPTGADAIAKAWCENNGVPQEPMPADWSTHGKAAGPIRNLAMIQREPRPETYVAFHKGGSRGTADMIERCRAAGIKGTIYGSEQDAVESFQRMVVPQFSEPGPAPVRQTQVRLTFPQVREHGMARMRGQDHRSYSQVNSFKECGVKYALDDLEVSAWWNVGGTALHYACEWLNREAFKIQATFGDGPEYVRTDHEIEVLWTNCLNRATSEAIAEHPTIGPDQWRAAKKGSEGYDWWRINGVDMVRRWVTRLTWLYDQGWRIAEFNDTPAIEYDCPMWIHTSVWPPENRVSVKVENIIDLALTRDDGTLLIIDAKSGASAPDDTAQLGQYAWALAGALSTVIPITLDQRRILGAYWLARTDALDIGTTDLRELHPWDELEYLITTMDAAERQGLYLPNKTKTDKFGCGSCGVRGLCPVGPS